MPDMTLVIHWPTTQHPDVYVSLVSLSTPLHFAQMETEAQRGGMTG